MISLSGPYLKLVQFPVKIWLLEGGGGVVPTNFSLDWNPIVGVTFVPFFTTY